MKRWMGILFAALAMGLVLSAVEAGDNGKKSKADAEVIFKKLDTNSNNILSRDEFVKLAERFKDKEKARVKLAMAYDRIDPQNLGLSKVAFRKYLESVRKKDDN